MQKYIWAVLFVLIIVALATYGMIRAIPHPNHEMGEMTTVSPNGSYLGTVRGYEKQRFWRGKDRFYEITILRYKGAGSPENLFVPKDSVVVLDKETGEIASVEPIVPPIEILPEDWQLIRKFRLYVPDNEPMYPLNNMSGRIMWSRRPVALHVEFFGGEFVLDPNARATVLDSVQ